MQRVLPFLGRAGAPIALAAPGAVASHHAASQNAGSQGPAANPSLAVEEHEGFVHIGFDQPIQHNEVAAALSDLSALGGGGRRPMGARIQAPAPPHAAIPAGPLIEEAESDASSEGSELNNLMTLGEADFVQHQPGNTMALMADVVTNVLNNAAVVNTIERALLLDPVFIALMDECNARRALPPPPRVLLVEELPQEQAPGRMASHALGDDIDDGASPMAELLAGLVRGVGMAALRIGESFAHLGNFLRKLGDSLSHTLASMEASSSEGDPQPQGARRGAHNMQATLVKLSCAVAVVVFTRRIALASSLAAI